MKQLYTLVVLCSTLAMNAYAQSASSSDDNEYGNYYDNQSTQTQQQVQNSNNEFRNHWTIGLKGGINYFHLTPELTSDKVYDGSSYGVFSDISQQVAVFSEYTFNYGLGLGAYFGNYSFNRQKVLGSSMELGVYAHINLLECFAWRKAPPIARRFHIFLDAGLGAAAIWQNNFRPGDKYSDTVTWRASAVIRAALQFEFMVRPQWGLLLEGEYHGYGKSIDYYKNVAYSNYPWINSGMINVGVRYYFDNSKKEADPNLDENDLPIRKPRVKPQKSPRNAVYVNVTLTPEMIEEAINSNQSFSVQATESGTSNPNVQVSSLKHSHDVEKALQTLAEQGAGTVLINSIQFENNQLTSESMSDLDEIANSLLANKLWQKVELLYMSNQQANTRAALIATYLRAKGIKNLSVKGVTAQSEGETSDLIISIM